MTTRILKEHIQAWDVSSYGHVITLVRETLPLLTEFTSITVLDVGSNVGKFIELLMENGVTIDDAILIEPVTELLDYSKWKFPRFKFINSLVSRNSEPLALYVAQVPSNLGVSRIVVNNPSINQDHIKEFTSIDLPTLLTKRYPDFKPTLIKIDAEGFDAEIVEGLLDWVRADERNRPIIVFEASKETDATTIAAGYAELGYSISNNSLHQCSRDIFLIPPRDA